MLSIFQQKFEKGKENKANREELRGPLLRFTNCKNILQKKEKCLTRNVSRPFISVWIVNPTESICVCKRETSQHFFCQFLIWSKREKSLKNIFLSRKFFWIRPNWFKEVISEKDTWWRLKSTTAKKVLNMTNNLKHIDQVNTNIMW